jgi:hypothetical protein
MDIHGVAPLLQVFDLPTTVWSSSEPGDHCDWYGLRLNGAEVMLNAAYEADRRPPAPDPKRIATHEDTSLLFGCKDLDGAYQHLRARAVELQAPKLAPYGMRQLWFKAPDGYGLCSGQRTGRGGTSGRRRMGLGFDGPNFRHGALSLRSGSWGGPMGPAPTQDS